MPQRLVLPSASALFLFFAYRSWCDSAKGEEDAETKRLGGHGALFSSFAPSFVAEPGDKTQLALIALVAGTGKLWAVFLGGTLALWAVSVMGILLGSTVPRRGASLPGLRAPGLCPGTAQWHLRRYRCPFG